MDAEPFHVVDLVSEVGKKQVGSVDQRTRGDVRNRNPAQPHGNAGPPAKPAFQKQHIAVRKRGAVADVEIIAAFNGELSGRRPADKKGLEVAVGVEATFGEADQGAAEPAAARRERKRLETFV